MNVLKGISSRDVGIDILRMIGIFCIILAHTFPPLLINNLRQFDVPLMVVISGYLFTVSHNKQEKKFSLLTYLKSRFLRLVLPAWVFFSLFFGVFYLLDIYSFNVFPFTRDDIITTYLLLSGVGYVWIIRIFLLVALFGPLFVWIFRRCRGVYIYLGFIFLMYQVIFDIFVKNYTGNYKELIIKGIFFFIPYLLLFLFGAFFKEQKRKGILALLVILGFLLYSTIGIPFLSDGTIINLQDYKYPARTAYFYYGLFVSLGLLSIYSFFRKKYPQTTNTLLSWIGSSTFSIYLAHIPVVFYFQKYAPEVSWEIRFFYAVTLALLFSLGAQLLVRILGISKIFGMKV